MEEACLERVWSISKKRRQNSPLLPFLLLVLCVSHALLFACYSSLLGRELCEARMSLTSFSGYPQWIPEWIRTLTLAMLTSLCLASGKSQYSSLCLCSKGSERKVIVSQRWERPSRAHSPAPYFVGGKTLTAWLASMWEQKSCELSE